MNILSRRASFLSLQRSLLRSRQLNGAIMRQPVRCLSETILDTEKKVHENSTRRLLNAPNWDAPMRHKAQQSIKWWMANADGDDGINSFSQTWSLWLRLLETNNHDGDIDEELLHRILNLWAKQLDSSTTLSLEGENMLLSPGEMFSLVQEYSSRQIFAKKMSDTTYNIILSALQTTLSSSRIEEEKTLELADNILDQMISTDDFPNPTIVTFATVLNLWASSTHPQRIARVQRLEKQRKYLQEKDLVPNLKPTLIYKSSLINAYAKASQPQDCEAIWNQWWQDCAQDKTIEPPNIQVATTILSGWAGAPSRAEAFLRNLINMHRGGKLAEPPNVFTYTVVLDAWAKSNAVNGAERAERILWELRDHDALQPNVVSYTSVIDAYAKRGDNDKVSELLSDMINAGFQPNTMTFNAILQYEKVLGRARGMLRSMRSMARSKKWDCAPDVASYTATIRLCAKRGDSLAAEQVWKEMKGDKIIPDATAYNNLLNAFAKAKMPVKAQALLEGWIQAFLADVALGVTTTAEPEIVSFNTVLSAWCDCKNMNKAESLFQYLKDLQPRITALQPSVITYTILLNCCFKSPLSDEAMIARVESLFREMEEEQELQPNLICYSTLCKCFARCGMGNAAMATLSMMRSRGIEPNHPVYAQVLHSLAEQCVRYPDELSTLEDIDDIMREMIESGVKPTVPMFSAWLKAIGAASIPDKSQWATDVVNAMKSFGLRPNEVILRQVKQIQDKSLGS